MARLGVPQLVIGKHDGHSVLIKLVAVDGVIHISVEEFERVIADTRSEVIEESVERVDKLMINTVCNPLIKTREQIDTYLQCIRDAKKAIRGESDDN